MRHAPTLCELSRLSWHRPALDAPAVTVADWYDAKSATHQHLAAEAACAGDVLGAARETGYARQAAVHAARLRVGVVA